MSVLITIGSFLFLIVILLICLVIILRRKKAGIEKDNLCSVAMTELSMDNDFQLDSGAKRFSYEELLEATNNFAQGEKLGLGGFGSVYRGYLKSLNSYVAIKRVLKLSTQGLREYASEVKVISRLRHRNLVQLIGWCHRNEDLLLVYEFMSNRSLDFHLFESKSSLTWPMRHNIARGMASVGFFPLNFAVFYLHEECEKCVLHRDIKSSNVMLDSCFNPKLGDFGLSRLVDYEAGFWQTTMLGGTLGCMAPECVTVGRASRESDVYSFRVVALEIATGRKAVERVTKGDDKKQELEVLVEWVWELYGMEKILEAVDPKLCGEFDEENNEEINGCWAVVCSPRLQAKAFHKASDSCARFRSSHPR
ncbi:L-type lectin-domain containing receptor kinase IX.1 [Morus notabilis]|uniref:L-type lectin-domain containing receptor kinase IX.1 n=1 Tax=Morus notabilis TaxID=981085 RepID=W9SYG4_9ROSA|nr:L-type lectin-domain containing receptor kinase IX.1 [Morus notabilis]